MKQIHKEYEVVSKRKFLCGNTYSAQNLLYELTDAMSRYRDYSLRVEFESLHCMMSCESEVAINILKEKQS